MNKTTKPKLTPYQEQVNRYIQIILHLVAIFLSGKGGTGKSTAAMLHLLWSYYRLGRENNKTLAIVDFDKTNRTLSNFNYGSNISVFVEKLSEDKENNYGADLVGEKIITQDYYMTNVDTAADDWIGLSHWLQSGGLSLLLEYQFFPIFFFVTDGSPESKRQIAIAQKVYGEEIPLVVVCNRHFKLVDFRDTINSPELAKYRDKFSVIEIPNLPELPLQMVYDAKIPFAYLPEDQNFQIFLKRKLTILIPQIFAEFDKAYASALKFITKRYYS